MWECLGISALAVTMNFASAQDMKKVGDNETITAIGSDQKDHGDGNVSFRVNANKYLKPWHWPSFLASKYTAVVFNGEAKKGRECPYYSNTGRPRVLTNTGSLIYKVETRASPEEIEAIQKAGCLITESPTMKELGFEGSTSQPE